MVRHPSVYAELLGTKIREHDADCWLVNTGMTGGPYGVGHRIPLRHTRSMIDAILSGTLDETDRTDDPVFGLSIPASVPDVPSSILEPWKTWHDRASYDEHAFRLASAFEENFERYREEVAASVRAAGPSVEAVCG